MFILERLKTLQHVSIIIQIIFMKLVCSLLNLLILKFVKNVKVNVVMRQHNISCVYVHVVMRQHKVWCVYVHVHTPNLMLPHHHIDFYIFNKF